MGKRSGKRGPDPGEGGRSSKYDPKVHDRLAYMVALHYGFNAPKNLQKELGISKATFYAWLREHETFHTEYYRGIDDHNNPRMGKALLREAEGYDYHEITWEPIPMGDDGKPLFDPHPAHFGKYKIPAREGMVATKVVKKRARSNGRLIEFWLRNRNQQRFRDVKQLRVGGTDGAEIPVEVTPGSELWEVLQEFTKAIRPKGSLEQGDSEEHAALPMPE
jgi:hypothetical protein